MSCITEILKMKGDKDFFIPLNKNGEPTVAVEGGGTYRDHEFLIVLNHHGFRCGYVALPATSKYNEVNIKICEYAKDLNYNEVDVHCHGGLTFMSREHILKDSLSTPCDDIWIGFDCGHAYDHCDVEAFRRYYGDEETKENQLFFDAMNIKMFSGVGGVKNYAYVEEECHSIINQLIGIEELKPEVIE